MNGFIYLIEFNNLYKIGYSVNPENRLKQLCLGESGKIVFKKNVPHPRKFENILHKEFSDKQVSGEWYNLSESDLDYVNSFEHDSITELLNDY